MRSAGPALELDQVEPAEDITHRFIASADPRHAPCRAIASYPYLEQEG